MIPGVNKIGGKASEAINMRVLCASTNRVGGRGLGGALSLPQEEGKGPRR